MLGFTYLRNKKNQLELEINNLDATSQSLQNKINNSNQQIKLNQQTILQLENKINLLKQNIVNYEETLNKYSGIIEMDELGLNYTPASLDVDINSKKITDIQEKIGILFGEDKVIITTKIYKIDNSESKGKEFQKAYCENLLIGFNSYFEKKKKSITKTNYTKTIKMLEAKFNKFNKKAQILGVSISTEYFNLCCNLLKANLDYKISKSEEKERIKEEKRKIKEQENLLAEAEKAKLELQKQRRMYEQSLTKALTEQERQEFEAKLKEIDKREADVDYRINNSRAGYLYITATKAMPNMTKLGVTRRLNPLVRIQELSSAATPYPFVCYGLIFSDNAFDLETRIHEYFDSKRVNTENKHKEFFYITPQEAIKVLKEEFGCDVHFVNEESEDEIY